MLREEGVYETADKLEKFIIKIAIFGVLYIVPVLTVIACSVYEVGVLNKEIIKIIYIYSPFSRF